MNDRFRSRKSIWVDCPIPSLSRAEVFGRVFRSGVAWFQRIGRDAVLIVHNERPVPLEEVDLGRLPDSQFVQSRSVWPRLIGKALRADLAPVLVFAPRRNASEEMAQAIASAMPSRDPLDRKSG